MAGDSVVSPLMGNLTLIPVQHRENIATQLLDLCLILKRKRNMSVTRKVIHSLPVVDLPGWESQLVYLEFPPGSAAAKHTHPVSGISYIIKGRMISHYEGEEVKECGAGATFIDPANTLHIRAENASETEWLHVLVTYVVKKGQPTAVPA